jgi:plastocyanin
MKLNCWNRIRRWAHSRNADGSLRGGWGAPNGAAAAWALLAPIVAAVAAAAAPVPTAPPPGQLKVSATLVGGDGSKRPAEDTVVWLPGAVLAQPARDGGAAKIAQRHKAFEPHVEVVPAGATVAFPNFDRIYHNVFSLSEIARFDLGLYRNGASRSVTFAKPGVIRIYCNIHPSMSAFLVVVDGKVFAKTGADGGALLPPVRPGAYRLNVWHERVGEQALDVTVKPGTVTPVAVSLDASRWRPEAHKNKHGKDYPPPDDDQTRY